MRMLYYRAGLPAIGVSELEELGLEHLGRPQLPSVECYRGPDGAAGVVFAGVLPGQECAMEFLGYYPGKQVWERVRSQKTEDRSQESGDRSQNREMGMGEEKEATGNRGNTGNGADGGLWVGYYRVARPRPADFVRPDVVDGHWVVLGDGNKWLIPVARMVSGETRFPRKLAWNGRSFEPGAVVDQFVELWEDACRLWEHVVGSETSGDGEEGAGAAAGEVVLTYESECLSAMRALQVNYAIGGPEISALGLFTTDTEMDVIQALLDFPGLRSIQKKTEFVEESGEPG